MLRNPVCIIIIGNRLRLGGRSFYLQQIIATVLHGFLNGNFENQPTLFDMETRALCVAPYTVQPDYIQLYILDARGQRLLVYCSLSVEPLHKIHT